MPSSPEPHAWQPTEFTAAPPRSMRTRPHRLFEVTRPGEVPDEVMAPARAAAEASGYAAGWAKGVQAARAVVSAEHEAARRSTEARAGELLQALAAVETAARGLEQRSGPALDQLEDVLLRAAFDIAEAVVGARLRDDEQRGLDALRRVLAIAGSGETVRIRLHPADAQVLRTADLPPGVEVVPD